MKLITSLLHLVPRLRASGAVLLLPLYAFTDVDRDSWVFFKFYLQHLDRLCRRPILGYRECFRWKLESDAQLYSLASLTMCGINLRCPIHLRGIACTFFFPFMFSTALLVWNNGMIRHRYTF